MRGSWRLNKDCNILTSSAPLDIAVCLSCSPGLLNWGPGAQLSAESLFSLLDLEHCFKLWTATAQSGVLRAPVAGCCSLYSILSPTHLISNCLTSCLHPGNIIVRRPLFFLRASQIALIQPVYGQGYILIFLARMHLLFTQVHFLFWQLGRGQCYISSFFYDGFALSAGLRICWLYLPQRG